ncbi:PREDICTED: translin-associated factor X-interacting protein 1-like [Priapulus caudatus]|uniref:Translin-associated factor X-interacting protein 1-like n=1 Tax=Priapulus caudatus TaxID=37621 RepID=A0ABM1E1Y1_PRICU|nr:PREDICTED: translin-associated factor X-interacting protein 1-like [Priapulus caudatus]
MKATSDLSLHKFSHPANSHLRRSSVVASTRIQTKHALLHSRGADARALSGEKLYNDLMRDIIQETRHHGRISVQQKLQFHRQKLELMAEALPSYRSLLTAIMHAYDSALTENHHVEETEQSSKDKFSSVEDKQRDCTTIAESEESSDAHQMQKDGNKVLEIVANLKEDKLGLEVIVEKLKSSLAEQYMDYREQHDARHLLVLEINELRFHLQEREQQRTAHASQRSHDDPVILSIALKKAREDLARCSKKLDELVLNYSDVVPRKEFKDLDSKFQIAEKQLRTLTGNHTALITEHGELVICNREAVSQRDEYRTKCELLGRSASPRPDWADVADHFPGGAVKWNELTELKSSAEKVMILLEDSIGGRYDEEDPEYFTGKGTSLDVPQYLRTVDRVAHHAMTWQETSQIVQDIWRTKINKDEELDEKRHDMVDFVYNYLVERFPVEKERLEMAYSLFHSCEKYSRDEDIKLFYRILTEETDEEVYHTSQAIINGLLERLNEADKLENETIEASVFENILATYFSLGTAADVADLLRVADSEKGVCSDGAYAYLKLFERGRDEATPRFVRRLAQLVNRSRKSYIDGVVHHLEDRSRQVNPGVTCTRPISERAIQLIGL